jgi:hypothetical protein
MVLNPLQWYVGLTASFANTDYRRQIAMLVRPCIPEKPLLPLYRRIETTPLLAEKSLRRVTVSKINW